MSALKQHFAVLAALVLISAPASYAAETFPISNPAAEKASMQNEDAVLRHLRSAFKHARKGARLYYTATDCNDNFVPFEKISIDEPRRDSAELAAVRRLFASDPRVRAIETKGIVKIYIGDVPDALLQTRISRFKFEVDEQYTGESALVALMNSAEIATAENQIGLHRPVGGVMDIGIQQRGPGLPHLPPVLRDVTLDQALDAIAETFNSVVEFGICENGKIWDANFSGGYNFDDQSDDRPSQ